MLFALIIHMTIMSVSNLNELRVDIIRFLVDTSKEVQRRPAKCEITRKA